MATTKTLLESALAPGTALQMLLTFVAEHGVPTHASVFKSSPLWMCMAGPCVELRCITHGFDYGATNKTNRNTRPLKWRGHLWSEHRPADQKTAVSHEAHNAHVKFSLSNMAEDVSQGRAEKRKWLRHWPVAMNAGSEARCLKWMAFPERKTARA